MVLFSIWSAISLLSNKIKDSYCSLGYCDNPNNVLSNQIAVYDSGKQLNVNQVGMEEFMENFSSEIISIEIGYWNEFIKEKANLLNCLNFKNQFNIKYISDETQLKGEFRCKPTMYNKKNSYFQAHAIIYGLYRQGSYIHFGYTMSDINIKFAKQKIQRSISSCFLIFCNTRTYWESRNYELTVDAIKTIQNYMTQGMVDNYKQQILPNSE